MSDEKDLSPPELEEEKKKDEDLDSGGLPPPRPGSWRKLLLTPLFTLPLFLFVVLIRWHVMHNEEGEDDEEQDDEEAEATIFSMGNDIDTIETSFVICLIVAATLVLDALVDFIEGSLQSDVYQQLMNKLYRELMLLGLISFGLFVLTSEGFIDEGSDLFEEIEYAHVLIFYLGLSMVLQAMILAGLNHELKQDYWYAGSLDLPQLKALVTRDAEKNCFSHWTQDWSSLSTPRILELHLYRLIFLDVFCLPGSFNYLKYMNDTLDLMTTEIPETNFTTWVFLCVVLLICAPMPGGVFLGDSEAAYMAFLCLGVILVIMDFIALQLIDCMYHRILKGKAGGLSMQALLGSVSDNWEEGQDNRLTVSEVRDSIHQHKAKEIKESKAAKVVKTAQRQLFKWEKMNGMKGGVPWYFKFVVGHWMEASNLMTGFYIALIIGHWGWYSDGWEWAFVLLIPVLIQWLALKSPMMNKYALLSSVGKADPDILGEVLMYMEETEMCLKQVASIAMDSGAIKTLEELFASIDTDGNQRLSYKELRTAMLEANLHIPLQRFKALCRTIDVDGNGSISLQEFINALSPFMDGDHQALQSKSTQKLEVEGNNDLGEPKSKGVLSFF